MEFQSDVMNTNAKPRQLDRRGFGNAGPIETKMRSVLDRLKGCKYPDNFDWSVYDKIAARFGDTPPRGGVVFNTGLKLVNHHSSCVKCHYAFELDSYGRGCVHDCSYCYAKEALTAHGYWNNPMPFPVNLAELRKVFFTVFETAKASKWRPILEKRIPLRLGSMSDSFNWSDRKYKVSHEILKMLSFYDYPYIVFTRSDLVAEDEYLEVIRKDLASIQFSISGGNEALTRKIEPGAPSVERRLRALEKLATHNIWTTVRLNPFFPPFPDGYFTDRDYIQKRFGESDVPKFELFDWDFISQLRDAKVPSALAGVVRLSPVAIKAMSRATGLDFSQFYRPELSKGNFDRRYSEREIAYYYKRLQVECHKNKIRFNTCYIGNGTKDFYQHQSLWANRADCCDAKGNVAAFKESSQNISWEVRTQHAPDKASALTTMKQDQSDTATYELPAVEYSQPGLRLVREDSPARNMETS